MKKSDFGLYLQGSGDGCLASARMAGLAIEKRVALLEQLGEGVLPVVVPDVQYIIEGHH